MDFLAQVYNATGHDREATRNIIEAIHGGSYDVDIWSENLRVIREDAVEDILAGELLSDLYVLGCFNAWALADATDLPLSVFEALHKAQAFEAAGELVEATSGAVGNLAHTMISHGDDAAHFGHYAGSCEEVSYWSERENRRVYFNVYH